MIVIARFTLQEALRRRLVLLIGLLGLLFLGLFLFGIHLQEAAFERRDASLGINAPPATRFIWMFFSVSGLYMVSFLGSLIAVLGAAGSLSGELEAGTLLTLVTKPISRSALLLGRWLGLLVLTLGFIVLLGGGLIIGEYRLTGYLPPASLAALGLMLLSVAFLVTFTLMGSTSLGTLPNAVLFLLLYGLAWAGGIAEAIGRATATPLLVRLGQISRYLFPTNALWRGASYYLQDPSFKALGVKGINPFFGGQNPPSPHLLLWSLTYLLAILGIAIFLFQKRDL